MPDSVYSRTELNGIYFTFNFSLIRIPGRNRSRPTSINFIHVRSLHIVQLRSAGGGDGKGKNVLLSYTKRDGKLSRGNCHRRGSSEGNCRGLIPTFSFISIRRYNFIIKCWFKNSEAWPISKTCIAAWQPRTSSESQQVAQSAPSDQKNLSLTSRDVKACRSTLSKGGPYPRRSVSGVLISLTQAVEPVGG